LPRRTTTDCNNTGTLLKNLESELRSRITKQTRRWIKHIIDSPNRGGMSLDTEQELRDHTRRPRDEQENPNISLHPGLSSQALEFWRTLHSQRKAAMASQGQSFEVVDWWVPDNCGEAEARIEKLKKAIHGVSARMKELEANGNGGLMNDHGVDNEEGEPTLQPPKPVDADCHGQNQQSGDVQLPDSYDLARLSPAVSSALGDTALGLRETVTGDASPSYLTLPLRFHPGVPK